MNDKRVDAGAIIDSASFIGKPLSIAAMMIVICLTDGFDLFIPSYIAPALVDDWGISKAGVQPFVQAGLIGMAIGSVILGWIGDRIGRKKAYVSCLALMFIGSAFLLFRQHDFRAVRLAPGHGSWPGRRHAAGDDARC